MFFLLLVMGITGYGQDADQEPDQRPVRSTFQSALLLNNQSVMVPAKGTFEFDIIHRFGTVGNGYEDLFGFYASSNIKLGFTYAPKERLSIGFGLTKRKHILDFNAKYAIIQQTRSGSVPVSVTYFGNMAVDSRKEEVRGEVFHSSDRLSFFNQLIVARRVSSAFSVQLAGSMSHFNLIDKTMKNDHFAVALGGKIKIMETMSGLFNIDQPVTKHDLGNPNPNVSFGIEVATSSHAFQIFLGNYSAIIPQENNVFNSNNIKPEEGETLGDNFLIGFNITRLWNW
jgi:hypothetical protein